MLNFQELQQYMSNFLWAGDLRYWYLLFVIFVTGKTLKNAFRYLGLELNRNIQNITLDQIHYISLLQSLTQKLINTRNAISDVVQ